MTEYNVAFQAGYDTARADLRSYGRRLWRHSLECPRWHEEPGTTRGRCILADNGCDGRWVLEIDADELVKERIGHEH